MVFEMGRTHMELLRATPNAPIISFFPLLFLDSGQPGKLLLTRWFECQWFHEMFNQSNGFFGAPLPKKSIQSDYGFFNYFSNPILPFEQFGYGKPFCSIARRSLLQSSDGLRRRKALKDLCHAIGFNSIPSLSISCSRLG